VIVSDQQVSGLRHGAEIFKEDKAIADAKLMVTPDLAAKLAGFVNVFTFF
jgi:hypothetical protein